MYNINVPFLTPPLNKRLQYTGTYLKNKKELKKEYITNNNTRIVYTYPYSMMIYISEEQINK